MDAPEHREADSGPTGAPISGSATGSIAATFARTLTLGDLRMVSDDFTSALESYETALSLLGDDPDWRRERAEAWLRIAECHRKRGEFQEALADLGRLRQGIDPRIDSDLDAKIVGRIGMVLTSLGHYLEAQGHCLKAYESLRGGNDNEEIGHLELTLGTIASRLGQIDRAREYFESALFTFRRIDYREGIARSLNNLSLLLKSGPRWPEALDYLERALAVSEEAGNVPRTAAICLNMGILLTRCCEWTRALQALSRSLLINRELDNHSGSTKTHLALGNLKLRLGQNRIAASHYAQALEMARRHGYRREEVLALEFQGQMSLAEGRTAEARMLLTDALAKANLLAPEGDLVCEVKQRLALEAMTRGDLAEATRYGTEAAAIASQINNHCELGISLRILGDCAAQGGRFESAVDLLRKSVHALSDTPDVLELTRSAIRLASLLVEDALRPGHDGAERANQAIEIIEPIWEKVTRHDLFFLVPDVVEIHARGLSVGGDLTGAMRVLDRGLALLEAQARPDAVHKLQALRAELLEDQAEKMLSSTEEFQILQEFTPYEAGVKGSHGGTQRLIAQMASRLSLDTVLLATGPSLEALHVEASLGIDRPASMLRGLEPAIRSFGAGRGLWISGSGADPATVQGPCVALRLRPGEETWGVLVAGRKDREKVFTTRDFKLLSLFATLFCVAAEVRRQSVLDATVDALVTESEDDPFATFVTVDSALRQSLALMARVAQSDSNVLITGETGTGKGLLAQCIHNASQRSERPFVQVNCAALPEQLLESELFGHVQGAFTGAVRNKRGLIEEAEGGTLFLDEVDRCHRNVQAKLLHVLDRREFRPVGDVRARTANIRILCATNADLSEAIRSGLFLEDLYYRLNDFQISIPALRERREDIPVLVRRFLNRFTREMDRQPAGITRAALRILMDHEWRGNVRELEKCVRRMVVLCENGEWIGPDLLPPELQAGPGGGAPRTLRQAVAAVESELIRKTLEETGGNKSETSRRLQLSYPALLEKIRRYSLDSLGTRKKP